MLWSLAHIAVQPKGTLFLKVVFSFPPHLQNQGKISFLQSLTSMARKDNSLTMRASCLMVLSFLASNSDLHEPLAELGWVCSYNSSHTICLPRDFDTFFSFIISTDNWTLPQCNHFSRGVRHHREHTQLIGTPARSSGILKVYSNLTSSAGMSFAESSGGSSMGRSRTRTNSANSTDSHGNGHIDMTFDDDTHHYDKSQECPSDHLAGRRLRTQRHRRAAPEDSWR